MKAKIKKLTNKLLEQDFSGFIETLSNLRPSNGLTLDKAKEILKQKKKFNNIVLVGLLDKKIVGTATIIIEPKFIANGGITAHIEDLVVRKGYEGHHIGSMLMVKAVELAKENNCYKAILDCKEHLVPYYEKFNFERKAVNMKMYFDEEKL